MYYVIYSFSQQKCLEFPLYAGDPAVDVKVPTFMEPTE